ncbi:hypothetical protein R70199_07849 [Paraburkholderia domus]|nr:hypothetical protein R70199_07849 [Paraburkholderia domus]
MTIEKRACYGGATVSCRIGPEHAQRCRSCGTKVRDDLIDHHFFGFAASCSKAPIQPTGNSDERDIEY